MWDKVRYRILFIERRNVLITIGITFFVGWASIVGGCVAKKYRLQEIQCLAMNIYHEARGEPVEGKLAIAFVTMNRVRSSRFPDSVCQVVYQRSWSKAAKAFVGEFSWTRDNVTDVPKEDLAWLEALGIASQVYDERISSNPVGSALYYHASYMNPFWAKSKTRLAGIGNHVFYQ